MTSVFISHCSEDNYFVDFLVDILIFHRVAVWVDRGNLRAGDDFTAEIEQALSVCDSMLVVVSRHSAGSSWMTREIAQFKAIDPRRPVIPLVLEEGADPDEIYAGLGRITQVRFYESYSESFRRLFQSLGRTLFPAVENRKIPDRRLKDRRESSRPASPPAVRLRQAMYAHVEHIGFNLLEPIERWKKVGLMVRALAAEDSPLQWFDFADTRTGDHVRIDHRWLKQEAMKSWLTKSDDGSGWGLDVGKLPADDISGAAYIIDDLLDAIMNAYVVTARERRAGERRGGVPRRQDDFPR